jgi:gamma-glutamyl hydrolase
MKIGIIAGPTNYPDNYIKWVELSGATAVVIPYNTNSILKQIAPLNGIVWIGGAIENKRHTKQYSTYVNNLYTCYVAIKEYNDNGRKFPIWGTCSGFELLVLFSMHTPSPNLFDYIQHHELSTTRPLVLKKSRLKQWFSKELLAQMSVEPCVVHHHNLGFDIAPFQGITNVSVDDGFINVIEYKDYPFYGVQFHPERPFSPLSYQVSYELSLFLLHECKN